MATVDVWLPLSDNQLAGSARSLRFLKLAGRLKPGMTVLLFAYGFGSSWCALVLEVVDPLTP